MNSVKEYIETHKERFVNELIELLRLPSVSADPKFKDDVFATADMVSQRLKEAGAENIQICPTDGYPIVYGDKIIDASLPTVLVYGHYDVQPADPYDLWESPPFEPVIKNEIIYARGACDDKGQMYMHVKAFEYMIKENQLPCNVKFMIEGEEEVGSANLEAFVKANQDMLRADVILISDTSMISNDIPSITVGLRGLAYVEVELTGPSHDLHSGTYGGAVSNPCNALMQMVNKLIDEKTRKILIPGFYDDVEEISAEEKLAIANIPFSVEDYKQELNITETLGEENYSILEQTSTRPTLDVNGIKGGYQGEGAKTVLPSKASAKISMRLVPNQKSGKIAELFKEYFMSIAPKGIKVKVSFHHGGDPVVVPIDCIEYRAAEKAYEETFGRKPIPQRAGGSIPIVKLFEDVLKIKSIMMGFGLDSDLIHSPNEHFGIYNFLKGIETLPYFYKHYTEMKK
ncbi:MAG: dipeptidase [Bacteroidota bacterium]|nr:dipeptidase [Bacteroidota bacterium]